MGDPRRWLTRIYLPSSPQLKVLTPAISLCSLRRAAMRRSTSTLKTASLASFARCRLMSPPKDQKIIENQHLFTASNETLSKTSSQHLTSWNLWFFDIWKFTRIKNGNHQKDWLLNQSTWRITPQVFVHLLENGLNPLSPQQPSCHLSHSQHVSHHHSCFPIIWAVANGIFLLCDVSLVTRNSKTWRLAAGMLYN